MNIKTLVRIPLAVLLLLLIPFVAMQFTNEVNWKFMDFLIMGILLLCVTSLGYLVIQKVKSVKKKSILCAIILIVFFLIWAELAVGIFGTKFSGS